MEHAMSRRIPGLFKRGSTYYFRKTVPAELRPAAGQSEWVYSLKTTDRGVAEAAARLKADEVDAVMATLRAKRSATAPATSTPSAEAPVVREPVPLASLRATVAAYRPQREAALILERYDLLQKVRQDPAAFFAGKVIPWGDAGTRATAMAFGATAAPYGLDGAIKGAFDRMRRDRAAKLKAALAISDAALFMGTAQNLRPDADAASQVLLSIELLKLEIALLKGRDKDMALPSAGHTHAASAATHGTSHTLPKLSEALDKWAVQKRLSGWTEEREDTCRAFVRDFIEVVGDKRLDLYTKADARVLKEVYMALPSNWMKRKQIRPDKGLTFAAERARQLGMPPQNVKNINKKLNTVGMLFAWAQGEYDHVPNPMEGLAITNKSRARDERDSFTVDDLQKLFNSPVYTGCHSERLCTRPGPHVLRNSPRFWAPLISTFSGFRIGEVCSLRADSFGEVDGIPFMRVSIETKSGAPKRVPIHSELIRIGLLDLVERRRAGKEEQLFPEIKQNRKTKRWGDPLSKWFHRYAEFVGIKDDGANSKKTFHSTRHSFETHAKLSGVPIEWVNALQGHADKGMSGRYGDDVGAHGQGFKLMHQELLKVTYEGLDLSHLAVK